MLLLADTLARRYGLTPYAVLSWSAEEMSVNMAAYMAGSRELATQIKDAKGGAFPVVVLGGV